MSIEPVDTGSPFTIREVGGDGVEVVLVDRALPYRPFELTTTQRVEVTWYPGNPEATSTVLGSSEEPTTINGQWKDKYLGQQIGADGLFPFTVNDLVIQTAREAADVIDDLVRRGALVEVTWDTQIRHGHIEKFTKRWQNKRDLEWDMVFTWISRGEPTAPAVISQETSISETSATIEQQARRLRDQARPSFATTTDFQRTLTALFRKISDSVKSVQGAVSNLAGTKLGPFDAARRTIATCSSIVSQMDELKSFFTSTVAGTFDASVPLPNQTFGERLVAAAYAQTMLRLAAQLRRTAIERRDALASYIVEDILGTYRARAGDNLRDVSQIFYSTPNEWQRLLFFNELQDPALVEGQVIYVPKIASGGRQ